MTWADAFDLVRHVVELLFYLITGPLLAIFTRRYLARQQTIDKRVKELLGRLDRVSGQITITPKGHFVVILDAADETQQRHSLAAATSAPIEHVPPVTEPPSPTPDSIRASESSARHHSNPAERPTEADSRE